jgi:cyclophilin family peptidyl-prolyl cis-trans isomerase
MTLELYQDAKPVTVTNFLRYIRDGRFVDSFAHRLPQGFVLQGGAFTVDASNQTLDIPAYPAIANEAGPFPQYSNVTGTIVMAKVADNPNSATSSWFINLKNNNTGTAAAGNLDLQNSGFTVFGKVIAGLDVLTRFANFKNYTGADGTDLIVNVDDGALSTLPLKAVTSGQFLIQNLIFTDWTIVNGPVPVITSPSGATGTAGSPFSYQITATDTPNSYSVTGGALPAGLSLNASTGLISGRATGPVTVDLTVNATNGNGTGGAALTIALAAGPDIDSLPTVTTSKKVMGKGGKVTLKGSASVGTVTVEVKAGKGGFKTAKGSPTNWKFPVKGLKPGKYKFQVRATNATGQSTVQIVNVTIQG